MHIKIAGSIRFCEAGIAKKVRRKTGLVPRLERGLYVSLIRDRRQRRNAIAFHSFRSQSNLVARWLLLVPKTYLLRLSSW